MSASHCAVRSLSAKATPPACAQRPICRAAAADAADMRVPRALLGSLLQQAWQPLAWTAADASCCSHAVHQVRCAGSAAMPAAHARQQRTPSKQQQQQQGLQAAGEVPEPGGGADAVLAARAAAYQASRLGVFYDTHLARELLLKLNLTSVHQLPRLASLDLAISAKDLHGRRYAEKWEMLLPALALEYISGRPAEFVLSSLKYYRSRNAVTAVKVRLQGGEAFDMLQKLAYLVLPSQNAFSGISAKSFDKTGNLHFRVPRMINFPDFEEQFEVFENLGSLHVSINMRNGSKLRSSLLLTGLQLPLLPAKRGPAAAAPEEQEQVGALLEGSSSDEGEQ